jgi:predicted transcriptional regulator
MAIRALGSPFGSETRTRVLVTLSLLGSSFQRELSRLLGRSPSVVQKALTGLERDGLVAGRLVGRTRSYTLNPRYFGLKELEAFLARLAEADADLRQRTSDLRRRPRRAGKPL